MTDHKEPIPPVDAEAARPKPLDRYQFSSELVRKIFVALQACQEVLVELDKDCSRQERGD